MAETRTANRNAHRRMNIGNPLPPERRPWTVEKLQLQFPQHTREQVAMTLSQCREELGTDDRTKVMDCMLSKLTMKNAQ